MAVAIYQFGPFILDCGKFELFHKGIRLRLERKPLELLVLLVSKHGQVVTREEIAGRLWEQEVFVDVEHGINTAIRKIRQTLGDSPDLPQFVQTISGSGYRFIAAVTAVEPEVTEAGQSPGVPIESAALPEVAALSRVAAIAGIDGTNDHPVRPSSPKRWWVLATVTCVVLASAAILIAHERHPAPRPVRAIAARSSLAIMPVVNRSGDSRFDAASDGLTDDLIRQLSQVPALRLIARSTVFEDVGKGTNPQVLGRALGVNAVLLSELRRTPDHLMINAELSNVADGSVLLDREYIVEGDDLRSVQADLQRDVIVKLNVEASALDPGRKLRSVTSSPAAYQDFLEGTVLARTATPVALHQAIGRLQDAVALDPDFDLAWAALGSEQLLLALYFEAPRQHMPLAREYAQHALRLNPALGEAHGVLGLVHLVYDWDLPAADAEMTTADAEEAAINELACTAHLMERVGKARTAEAMLTRMLTYNPRATSIRVEVGCVNYYHGNYDAALRAYRTTLIADPHAVLAYWGEGKTLNAQRKYTEAIAALDTCQRVNGFEPPLLQAETGYAYGASGQRQAAMEVVRSLRTSVKGTFVDPYLIAEVFASMNDRDQTFVWLRKGVEVRSPFMISLLSDPKWEAFRSDPRFTQILNSMMRGTVQ